MPIYYYYFILYFMYFFNYIFHYYDLEVATSCAVKVIPFGSMLKMINSFYVHNRNKNEYEIVSLY